MYQCQHISFEIKILNKSGINVCHCLPFGNFKELTATTKNAYTPFGPKKLKVFVTKSDFLFALAILFIQINYCYNSEKCNF